MEFSGKTVIFFKEIFMDRLQGRKCSHHQLIQQLLVKKLISFLFLIRSSSQARSAEDVIPSLFSLKNHGKFSSSE